MDDIKEYPERSITIDRLARYLANCSDDAFSAALPVLAILLDEKECAELADVLQEYESAYANAVRKNGNYKPE